jgi:class 3 adenylate cyclase
MRGRAGLVGDKLFTDRPATDPRLTDSAGRQVEQEGVALMTFDELLAHVIELLQRQGRVSYGALKRRFELDEEYLQDLKDELIDAQQLALDEDGRILIWRGNLAKNGTKNGPTERSGLQAPVSTYAEAERRQLTVLFCDLVGSTALSEQLDPEELRDLLRAYQEACAVVTDRFEGSIAQYLGDGILIYFGYPTAHEDGAARAVYAGLGIIEAVRLLNPRLSQPIEVRICVEPFGEPAIDVRR